MSGPSFIRTGADYPRAPEGLELNKAPIGWVEDLPAP